MQCQILLVKELLSLCPNELKKSFVNQKNKDYEFVPMHFASHNGCVEICKILLENGADLDASSAHGLNALHLAS